jgi:hypothetical protein
MGYLIFFFDPSEAPNGIMAALKCRKVGDFFKLLAIPLQQIGPKEFIRNPRERPVFLPIATLDRYVEQEIFIRNDNELTQDFLPPNSQVAFVFRKLPPAIEIMEVYPSEFWNPKDMTLQGLEPPPHEMEPWHAFLRLDVRKEKCRTEMLLILGVVFRESKQSDLEHWYFGKKTVVVTGCTLLESQPGKPLAQVQEEFRPSLGNLSLGFCEFQNVRVDLNGSFDFDKRPVSYDHSDNMCIVNITVGREEETEVG